MASAVTVLAETDISSLGHSVNVVQQLPSLAHCADVARLTAAVASPDDAHVAEAIHELSERLQRGRALQDAGRYSAALALVEEVVAAAKPLAYRPFLARARLAQGHITMSMGRRGDAAKVSFDQKEHLECTIRAPCPRWHDRFRYDTATTWN